MNNYSFELDEFAEAEFFDVAGYYKQINKQLSLDFIQEFDKVISFLQNQPHAGFPYLHNTKRVILNRFPYSVIYKIYENKSTITITVHAIAHMKRKPGYWQERIK